MAQSEEDREKPIQMVNDRWKNMMFLIIHHNEIVNFFLLLLYGNNQCLKNISKESLIFQRFLIFIYLLSFGVFCCDLKEKNNF